MGYFKRIISKEIIEDNMDRLDELFTESQLLFTDEWSSDFYEKYLEDQKTNFKEWERNNLRKWFSKVLILSKKILNLVM